MQDPTVNVELERALFEAWYRRYRKFDTDIHGNNLGNVKSHDELLTRNGDGYAYGQPKACWDAWIYRASNSQKIVSERCAFELWYKDYMSDIAANSELWANIIKIRGNCGYDNERTHDCSRAWAEVVINERKNAQMALAG